MRSVTVIQSVTKVGQSTTIKLSYPPVEDSDDFAFISDGKMEIGGKTVNQGDGVIVSPSRFSVDKSGNLISSEKNYFINNNGDLCRVV